MTASAPLTDCKISRGLIQLALPILGAYVLQSLNGSINSMWVAHYIGNAGLAAASSANAVMFLLTAIGNGIVAAASIRVGQRIGARELREAKRVVFTSLTFFATVSVGIAITGLILSKPILLAMQTPAPSLPLATAYTRIIFLSLPCLYVYTFVISLLTGTGDSRTPFYFLLLSVTLDIALNPLFILGVGPFPKLGIAGSALATTLSQTVTLFALVVYLYRQNHLLCLQMRDAGILRVDWSLVRALVLKGVPLGAQTIVISVSGMLMYSLVNRFGVDTAAAYGASFLVWNYVGMPAYAIAGAVSTMTAHNVGAQRWDRVHPIVCTGLLYSIMITTSTVLIVELLDRQAYSLFLPPASHALDIATHLFRIGIWSTVFLSVSFVLFGAIAASGSVIVPLCILTTVFLIVRITLASALLDTLHADAIWWSFSVSSAFGLVLASLYYKYGRWRKEWVYDSIPGT